jgi:hypothetical protein
MDRLRWERWVLALLACALVYQVLCEPIVGTADNRDYGRVMRQVGLVYNEDYRSTLFVNLQRKFQVQPAGPFEYLTTQVPIAWLAKGLNALLSKDGLFDIRVQGATNGLLYLGAVWVLLLAFARRSWPKRILIGVASLVMFSDVRIVAYFNSFLSESSQVIALLATLGFAFLANDPALGARKRAAAYLGFVICAVAFLLAKSQDLAFAPSLALIAYVIVPKQPALRSVQIGATLLLLAIPPYAMLTKAYGVTTATNARVTLNEEILPHSKDPAKDLAELADGGIANVTLGRIAKFYLSHPARWWRMARRRMKETHSYVEFGNFEAPHEGLSQAFDEWSELKRAHYPRDFGLWLLAGFAYAALLRLKWQKQDVTREQRNQTLVHGALLVGLLAQYFVVVTFEANGTAKHFFIFNVLADLLCLLAFIDVVSVTRAQLARLSASPRPVERPSSAMGKDGASDGTSA